MYRVCGTVEREFSPMFGDTQELLWLKQHKVKMLSQGGGWGDFTSAASRSHRTPHNGPREIRRYPGIIKKSRWD